MPRSMAKIFPAALIFAAAFSSVAQAAVRGSFERTLQVSGPVDLQVFTRSGDISVRNGPAGTARISGKIHVEDSWFSGRRQDEVNEIEKNPPIHQDGNNIHIDYLNYHGVSVDYEITVPADTTLHTQSGSGDQRIEGLTSAVDLESGSGDMTLRNLGREVRLHTGSGNVEAHDILGPFTAETGSGDIRLEEKAAGDIRVHTGSGNVEVRGVNGALRAETGSGDVEISGINKGEWTVRTSSGDVDLQLPSDAAFDLDATAGSGSVVVDRPVTMTVQGDLRRAQHSIRGKVSGGGPQLGVHTGSGDIRIH